MTKFVHFVKKKRKEKERKVTRARLERAMCVWRVQDRQGGSLLVLVLHVQKPLHRSQHAGSVSGQESKEDRRDGTHSIPPVRSSYFLLFLLHFLSSSSKLNLLPWTLFFAVYWPLKHLEMHTTCKHMRAHTHTDVDTQFSKTKGELKPHWLKFTLFWPWACHLLFPLLICCNTDAFSLP